MYDDEWRRDYSQEQYQQTHNKGGSAGAQRCPSCGGVKDSPLYCAPISVAVVAYFIFLSMGGDGFLLEVNVFDYLAALMSVGAFISAFFLIPKTLSLFVLTMVITGFVAYSTVFYVLLNG